MKRRNIDYKDLAKRKIDEIYEICNSSLDGLTDEMAQEAREKFGANEIDYGEKKPLWKKIFQAYITPFTLILILLAIISFVTEYLMAAPGDEDLSAVIIMAIMVLLSGTMSLVQELKSGDATEKLMDMVMVTIRVKRNGKFSELDTDELVVGDIIELSAGDMIPADMRLIQTKDLFISQAALTGESNPLEKFAKPDSFDIEAETDLLNMAFMGSNVISGSALGIVVATGNDTLFGSIAKETNKEPEKTSFDKGVDDTSRILIKFMAVMAPLVIIINGMTKGDWLQAVLFGISVAVGLTPEMLPMIVTSNLVKGANSMSKKGVVVKELSSIQNFGAINVLCTDKTGTLTEDKVVLEYHMACDGRENDRVLLYAYLNSYYQTGLKNLMDEAIIEAARDDLDLEDLKFKKIDEVPFDFKRRKMSVVVEDEKGEKRMITKGAIEEIMDSCDKIYLDGKVSPLSQDKVDKVLEKVDRLNEDGFRVLGLAHKKDPAVVGEFSVKDESQMTLIGYLAFLDPPKSSAKKAIKALKGHGVDVKILTGDNALVTMSVAKKVGISATSYVTGQELKEMKEEEFKETIEREKIFVKLDPSQKAQIVKGLRENENVVGFMGDGINDSPALVEADIGISVDSAVDIAKESADIILLEKDLMVLENGILQGREIYGNIMKYIKATTSSNFGNVFSILIASIFLPFMPMEPLQLLFLNLIYDFSCISIPWDHMDSEYLKEPKKWDVGNIGEFMVFFGPTSSVFDISTFLYLYFILCTKVAGGSYFYLAEEGREVFEAVFHTGWFVESLWSQTLVLHSLRTPKLPFIESRPSFIFMTITSLGIVFGTLLPMTGIGESLDLIKLPGKYYYMLAITVIAYLVLVTIVKKAYIKRHGELI